MLNLVMKCDARGTPKHIQTIEDAVGSAIMRVVARTATDRDLHAAMHLLVDAHQKDAWLACGCQEAGDPPLVAIVYRQDSKSYYLRRMDGNGRRTHAESCPFTTRKETRLAGVHGTNQHPIDPGVMEAPLSEEADLYLLNQQGEYRTAEPDEASMGGSMDQSPTRPRLARIMFHLLEKAGVNIIDPKRAADLKVGEKLNDIVRSQYHAIRQAAEKMRLCDGIALSECLWLHPDEITKARAFHKLRKMAGRWPVHVLPQGYLLTVAEDVTDGHLHFRNGTKIRVTGEISKYAPDHTGAKAPYWVIALVAQAGRRNFFEVRHAYAHPVFNAGLLVPVDSDDERETLKVLLGMQAWSMTNGMSPWISKPLHTLTPYGSNLACRPGFLMGREDIPGREVVVKTTDYGSEDGMSTLGEVVTHSLKQGTENTTEFKHAIASAIRRLQYTAR